MNLGRTTVKQSSPGVLLKQLPSSDLSYESDRTFLRTSAKESLKITDTLFSGKAALVTTKRLKYSVMFQPGLLCYWVPQLSVQ